MESSKSAPSKTKLSSSFFNYFLQRVFGLFKTHLEMKCCCSFSLKKILCTSAPGFLSILRSVMLFCNFIELPLGKKTKHEKGPFPATTQKRGYMCKEPHRQHVPSSSKSKMCWTNQQLKTVFWTQTSCKVSQSCFLANNRKLVVVIYSLIFSAPRTGTHNCSLVKLDFVST